MDGSLARARPYRLAGHARSGASSEAALWGAIEAEGLLAGAVIVSDDAGQFRVGDHALCWVHAERLVHKLVPANDGQRNAVEVAKRMIWWFYRRLKDYKLAPSPEQASLLRSQFGRIFKRRTGYATLDHLLKRLLGRKEELLRVLARPETPLNTNASENDIRAFVIKRKIYALDESQPSRSRGGPTSHLAAHDVLDVASADADVAQLMVRVLRQFAHRRSITAPSVPLLRDHFDGVHIDSSSGGPRRLLGRKPVVADAHGGHTARSAKFSAKARFSRASSPVFQNS